MDIDRIMREYMHLNDPKYQGLTYKFAGAFLFAAIALGVAFWAGGVRDTAEPGGALASGTDEAQGGPDAATCQAAVEAWRRDHPGEVPAAGAPVERDGRIVGYCPLPP